MIKTKLLAFFIFLSSAVYAQRDFIILKKKDITITNYFTGSYINCELTNRQWIEGFVKAVRNDSLFINAFHINYLPSIWGTYIADTAHDGLLKLKPADIYAIPRKNHSLEYIKNGTIFQIGGAGYVLLNVINNLSNKNPLFQSKNISRLSIGAAIFLFGKILQWTYSSNLIIGKKYHLQYISMSASSQ